ncbi:MULTISPECIES: hypothetical protein [Spirosoma]|uniref:Universal stress protein n=1 Tax=Spirosoma liriopis TaxID=2937440 RepID=A0ABT0HPI9_9BACT|nr:MULTISPECIES: hypothetical protein [Spirosoma]MCK8493900.1 hypothetical protein [Spirosoma liriopis]UHG93551.1 hypothetical protein LQ777_11730 [Spirosoma oryzicola]
MKTVFFLTDCSVDSALFVRRWLTDQNEAVIRLTIVHPYDIEAGDALTKETHRVAKQQAVTRLARWLDMIPASTSVELKPETLLASPELAAKIHQHLRAYDYILVDEPAGVLMA